jgi:tripartite-type tricarboxylate transporter receptor subunit TctC
MMAAQAVSSPGIEFDTRKFIWLGNTTSAPNVINTWHTTGVTSVEQVKTREVLLGAPMGTAGALYPVLINTVAGTKFRVVTGYPGGNEVNLAMERGEVEGRGSNSWASWKSTKPDWLKDKKINILVQVALARHPDLPDVPLLMDLARTDEDRAALKLLSAPPDIGRPVFAPPGVPAERVKALRDAFDATMKDPAFLEAAKREGLEIDPVSGEQLQKIVNDILAAPQNVRDRLATLIEVKQ